MGLDMWVTKKVNGEREEVAYWRKCNQIHKWFVDKVQDGTDDCGEYSVTMQQMSQLVLLCKYLLEDKEQAAEQLPPHQGFFFGGYELDEWYWQGLEDTIKQLEKALAEEDADYYYQASW